MREQRVRDRNSLLKVFLTSGASRQGGPGKTVSSTGETAWKKGKGKKTSKPKQKNLSRLFRRRVSGKWLLYTSGETIIYELNEVGENAGKGVRRVKRLTVREKIWHSRTTKKTNPSNYL